VLEGSDLQDAVEEAKPNVELVDIVPFVHKVVSLLLQKLCHIVDQRIDQADHQHKVYNVAFGVRTFQLGGVFSSDIAAGTIIIDTTWIVVLL